MRYCIKSIVHALILKWNCWQDFSFAFTETDAIIVTVAESSNDDFISVL